MVSSAYQQEKENKRKALFITLGSYLILLLLFFLIRWHHNTPTPAPTQDLMEINLGNDANGAGDEQPLIKGNKTTQQNTSFQEKSTGNQTSEQGATDDADKDAASLNSGKISKTPKATQSNNNGNIVDHRKPKFTYTGPDKGKNGNNDQTDNDYKNQGNDINGKNDNGNPKGVKDSYGDTEGGKTGGPKIIRGNRRIVQNYEFEGDLKEAIIYATIKVSPNGKGKFMGFDKGTTNRGQAYANAITRYLNNIQFNTSREESLITVEFIFDIR